MSMKRLLAAGLIAGAASFAAPGAASAQSFGFSVSSGYPPPTYYDPGYSRGYYAPAYPAYPSYWPDWRNRERWERQEARRRHWQDERWEHEQDARRRYWDERREHRWHGDDDDDD